MEQQLAWAKGKPIEHYLLGLQSGAEAYYGHLAKAQEFRRRAVNSAVRANLKGTAASWKAESAVWQAEFGKVDDAKRSVAAALALDRGSYVRECAALTLARVGETARAKTITQELEKEYPSDTMVNVYFLPTTRAAIALNEGKPAQTILLLEPAEPYD